MTRPITELQKRLKEIIDLCDKIDALVNDVGLEGHAKPVLRALTKQADTLAAHRYKKVAGLPIETVQEQDLSGNDDLATSVRGFAKNARHKDQPAFLIPSISQFDEKEKPIVDENGAQIKTPFYIDFRSAAHVAGLLRQIRQFKIYARLAARTERQTFDKAGEPKVAAGKRGAPTKPKDPDGLFDNLTPTEKKCLEYDVAHSELHSEDLGRFKFKKSAAEVAIDLRISKRLVEKARNKPTYIRMLLGRRISEAAEKITAVDILVRPRPWGGGHGSPFYANHPRLYLEAYVKQTWTGPVVSVIDDQLYTTQAAYVEHLLAHEVIPGR